MVNGHFKHASCAGRLILLLVLLCTSSRAWAEVKVEASLNTGQASLEDDIELNVTVSGSGSVSEPQLPSMPNFKVIPQGTSSNIQIINGSMSVFKTFSYILIPQQTGDYTIPAIEVEASGSVYRSNPLNITITDTPLNQHRAHPPGIGPVDPFSAQPHEPRTEDREPAQDQRTRPNLPYWIEAGVSKNNPYQNEQILFTFRFYTSVNVGTATLTLPDFKDFSVEELVPEKKGYQTINGQRYVVSEKILALFPLKKGPLTIEPSALRVEVADEANPFNDPFFFGLGRTRLKAKNLKSKPITLDVRALPAADEAVHFTGLVGRFEASANLNPTDVEEGGSVSYEITLKGRGNIKDGLLPPFPSLPGIKVYEDNPSVDILRKETGVEGEKSFKKALVPTDPGTHAIPEVKMSYFDPIKEQYVIFAVPQQSFTARPSQLDETLNMAGGTQARDHADKLPDESSTPSLRPLSASDKGSNGGLLDSLATLLYILAPLAYLIILIAKKRPLKSQSASGRQCLHQFKAKAMKLPTDSRQSWAKGIESLLKEYFENRFGVVGAALTPLEMSALFENAGIGKDLCLRFEHMLRELESLIYHPSPSASFDLQEFVQHLEAMDQKVRAKAR